MNIYLDTETTGLDEKAEILQLAILDEQGNVLLNELYKPEHTTEWKHAEKINHISPDMVKDCRPFKEALPDLKTFFDDQVVEIRGYNVSFDYKMLTQNGLKLDSCVHLVDVLSMVKELMPDQRHDLASIAKHFQLDTIKFHDAADDAMACACIYGRFKDTLDKDIFNDLVKKASCLKKPKLNIIERVTFASRKWLI